jgi:hypothetical protein
MNQSSAGSGSRPLSPRGRSTSRYGRTWLYEATVRPDAVLAYLERRGEGWTVVVNPAGLSQIGRREELPPR